MTAVKKFMFETTFDVELDSALAVKAKAKEKEKAEVEVEEEPEPPTFSEAELEAARQEGFQRGHAEAAREQAAAIERQISDALNALVSRMQELFQTEETANEERSREAVSAALSIVRKLFPHLSDHHGEAEIEAIVRRAMGELTEESKITLNLHPDVVAPIKERIAALARESQFKGAVTFHADDALDKSDCRITWGLGGMERSAAELWQKIDEIVEENLGSDALLRHDDVNPPDAAAPDAAAPDAASPDAASPDSGPADEAPPADAAEPALETPDTPSDPGEDHG